MGFFGFPLSTTFLFEKGWCAREWAVQKDRCGEAWLEEGGSWAGADVRLGLEALRGVGVRT